MTDPLTKDDLDVLNSCPTCGAAYSVEQHQCQRTSNELVDRLRKIANFSEARLTVSDIWLSISEAADEIERLQGELSAKDVELMDAVLKFERLARQAAEGLAHETTAVRVQQQPKVYMACERHRAVIPSFTVTATAIHPTSMIVCPHCEAEKTEGSL